MKYYDRDRLAGAPPPDVDEAAYGAGMGRRDDEQAHAEAQVAATQARLEQARADPDSWGGQAAVDRLRRELVAWQQLAYSAGTYHATGQGELF